MTLSPPTPSETQTLTPLLQADGFAPPRLNVHTAFEELEDYQECYQCMVSNLKAINSTANKLLLSNSKPTVKQIEDYRKQVFYSGRILYDQYKNYQRRINTLSPHETRLLKCRVAALDKKIQIILDKSVIELRKLIKLEQTYYGRGGENVEDNPAVPSSKQLTSPKKLNERKIEERKKIGLEKLTINTKVLNTPILYEPDSA